MKQLSFTSLLALLLCLFVPLAASADTVTDIDGNVYQTVTIGSQVWMAENLKVTHYSNGDTIPVVFADSAAWTFNTNGLSCSYDNDPDNVATYGRLYNWFACVDVRNLAPAGWHVPTDDDWKQLEVFLGMTPEQADGMGNRGGVPVGAKLKEIGSSHWSCPNAGSTNETGFSALPGGGMDNRPVFNGKGMDAFFWAATEYPPDVSGAWARNITCNLVALGRNAFAKDYGGSVRCVRDLPVGVNDPDGAGRPYEFNLVQNYPNPFNPTTVIEYSVPTRSPVTIDIYNLLGEKVRTLVGETKSAGSYSVEWNGTDQSGKTVASGLYLYRIQAGKFIQSKKMLLLR
jgi:uncharacterized protein (TIGR02145 family)